MNTGLILTGVGLLVAVLGWMDLKPNGPRLLARLWAHRPAPHKELEALRTKTDEQATQIAELKQHVEDLQVVALDSALKGEWFYHRPEAERVRKAAEAITKRKK